MGYIDMPKDSIRCRREKAGMSRPQLAKALGVKASTLERWESGESRVTEAYVKRMARHLGCSPAELTGEIVTRSEFDEVKAAVARIEKKIGERAAPKASVYVDAQQIAEALGLADAHGVPVAVGDCLQALEGGVAREVLAVNVFAAGSSTGRATVYASLSGGAKLTAVDMRLPGHVVTRKATA